MVKATSRRQEYTPAGFADDLAWLCGQLRVDKPVVVGHSMGGNVAFELARRRPDLPAAIVAVDSAIIPAPWVIDAVKQHMGTLRGSGYQEGQKAWVSGFFLPTDDNQAASAGGVREGSAAVRFPRGQVAEGDLGFVLFLSCALRQSFRSFSAPTSPASPPPIQK